MLQRDLNPSPRAQQTLKICEQFTRLLHDCLNPPQDDMPIFLNDTIAYRTCSLSENRTIFTPTVLGWRALYFRPI